MEPAAQIPPEEAASVVEAQWSQSIQLLADAVPVADLDAGETESEQDEAVHLVRFNRRSHAFHTQLEQSPALKACREALDREGFEWKLSSGPSIFVHPCQYETVMRALPEHGMTQSDVVVAESLEYL